MSELSYTIIDSAPESLHKASVLVTGGTEALLVDAGFTRADGHRIVAEILDTGRTLTQVVITAGDPDFYFGAEVIADAFPEATFAAPADVIEHINHSYAGKLAAWAHLGVNLPTRLVEIAELTDPVLSVEGTEIEVRRGSDLLGDRAWYLFEPASRSLIGGVLLFEGLHVWTADSATPELRAEWIRALDQLADLAPTFVAAGHRVAGAPTDLTAISHTRDYLRQFEQVVTEAADAAAAKDKLLAAYPDAGLVIAADLGTKVAKGEMTWG
jgi:glyoxylase-like metal-dependent hydrolase (beta-lactamase superfamily II)